MTALRTLSAAALLMLTATPALAQSDAEIIGRYRMTVEPEPGSLCPAGQADFDVTRVGGRLIEVSLDRQSTIADWDPDRHSFSGRINFPDPEHPVQMNGSFSRGPDRVNLVVTVVFPPERPCRALLSGSIPVDASDSQAAAPSIPPSPTGPPVFGVAPNGEAPVYGANPPMPMTRSASGATQLKDWKLLSGFALIALLVGLAFGAMRAKGKKAVGAVPHAAPRPVAPPPEPTPPPAPEPEPEPPAPKPKAAAKKPAKPRVAKPKKTEEEDELGDG